MALKVTKVYVWDNDSGRGYYRAVSRNGQTVDGSQAYSNKANAKRAAINAYPDARIIMEQPK